MATTKWAFTAPSVGGQARAIADALAAAGVEPGQIGSIEAHGTGTPLGDPIELAALRQVFAAKTDRVGFCAVSSIKTNLGHLDAASGVTGLIKAALTLSEQKIPPNLHFKTANSALELDGSPFYINDKLSDWKAGDETRHAGVSSFGIGGANAHAVLAEAPAPAAREEALPPHLLVLSARTETALETMTENLIGHLAAPSQARPARCRVLLGDPRSSVGLRGRVGLGGTPRGAQSTACAAAHLPI